MAVSKPTFKSSLCNNFFSHLVNICDLNLCSGLFPSRLWTLSLIVWLPIFLITHLLFNGIKYIAVQHLIFLQSITLLLLYIDAIPKYISQITSYLQVRFAFHYFSQFIQNYCNSYWFVLPIQFYRIFWLTMKRSLGFGSNYNSLLLRPFFLIYI